MAPHTLLEPAPAPVEKTNTYVYIVLDESGSMYSITAATRKAVKKTLDGIKVNSELNKLDTYVSLRKFASQCAGYDFDCVKSCSLPTEISFRAQGNTALFDAAAQTIQNMQKLDALTGHKHSFLLIVITDGEENQSRMFSAEQLKDLMQVAQNTDRYTLTFQLPPGSKNRFCRSFGIPEGNVIEWENTERGTEQACDVSCSSFGSYATSRAQGVRSVKQYYITDLSNVSGTDLNKLTPVNAQAKVLRVPHETGIKPFVEAQLGFYRPGSAYYQLTKNEKLQAYKIVLIRDKASRKIYAGNDARRLMGLPDASPSGGIINVKVGNHSNFDVFVQSCSNNRKLVRGTDLIIWQ
jgi:hypothetical protein